MNENKGRVIHFKPLVQTDPIVTREKSRVESSMFTSNQRLDSSYFSDFIIMQILMMIEIDIILG